MSTQRDLPDLDRAAVIALLDSDPDGAEETVREEWDGYGIDTQDDVPIRAIEQLIYRARTAGLDGFDGVDVYAVADAEGQVDGALIVRIDDSGARYASLFQGLGDFGDRDATGDDLAYGVLADVRRAAFYECAAPTVGAR